MRHRIIDKRYEILRALSSGGFGVVHYAWDHQQQRPVAIKEIAPNRIGDPEVFEMFLDEAHIGQSLAHPNIVTVHDLRQDNAGHVYIVMEFLDGMDLETILTRLTERGKRLPAYLALHIVAELLIALDHAHSQIDRETGESTGIVHRDVSPPNIIITATGHLKLIDFGIAKARRRLAQKTKSGVLKGRLTYLSPEQVDARHIDARTDVFAAGIILFELTTGRRPFGSVNEFELLRSVSSGQYDRKPLDHAHLGEHVQSTIERALKVPLEERYASARAMLTDIQSAQARMESGDCQGILTQLVEALQTESEIADRRKLLMTRGGPLTDAGSIDTSPVRPALRRKEPADRQQAAPPRTAPAGVGASDRDEPSGIHAEASRNRKRTMRRRMVWAMIAAVIYAGADLWLGFGPLASLADRFGSGSKTQTATWSVETIPPGVQLYIDGEAVGATPHRFSPAAIGPVALRFELPGFAPYDTAIMVTDLRTELRLDPIVMFAPVHFRSVPEGAEVFVNGRSLSRMQTSHLRVAATDTIEVEFELEGEPRLSPARFNPIVGMIEPTDTTLWHWHPGGIKKTGIIAGTFVRPIHIHSQPEGALVFIDEDSVAAGVTNTALHLAYGFHDILLRRAPFVDYEFSIDVGQETPDLYAPVLRRTVRVRASDGETPGGEIHANIEWIRRGTSYLKTPFDNLTTPYSVQLPGLDHEIRLTHKDFADTTIPIGPEDVRVAVQMRPRSVTGPGDEADNDYYDGADEGGWTRFRVRDRRGPVGGAEVIGIEKSSGITVRYGQTDDAGEILTRVPFGDYEWRGAKPGYKGRGNGERIKRGRGLKTIRLLLVEQR